MKQMLVMEKSLGVDPYTPTCEYSDTLLYVLEYT